MLRLYNVDGGMISGLNEDELNFITNLSNESQNEGDLFDQWSVLRRSDQSYLHQLLSEVDLDAEIQELNITEADYHDLDEETTATLNVIEENEVPCSTKAHTVSYSTKFKEFLRSKSLPDSIETMPIRFLNQYLRLWYSSLRKIDGSYYSPSSLACIRAAVNRYLTRAPYNRSLNLKTDKDFISSNNMMKAMASKFLKSNESVHDKSHKALTDTDLQKLRLYFTRETPKKLQQEVLFNIIYHKGYRGREWMKTIELKHLVTRLDERGVEYAD